MTTLLVVTKQSSFASAIQSVLDPKRFQIIAKDDVWEAESLLGRGAIDICIVDVELTDVRAIRLVEELKNSAPSVPLLLYAGSKQWEWEEDAYLLGVEHVLNKPVRAKILNALLERLIAQHPATRTNANPPPPQESPLTRTLSDHARSLTALRRFSGILTHSLDPDALLKEFLLVLREIIGVNRAMVFLRRPSGPWTEPAQSTDDRWLRCACAIGLEQTLLDHFALSLNSGIGGYLYREGRILRAHGAEASSQREILKEFQLLGVEVAIPILDRESLVGIAVFDERLTGDAYSNEELALIFHMLEEVGLAIKNSWLHNQLRTNHEMLVDILGQLGSGCVVVGSNMTVLHANSAVRRMLLGEGGEKKQLEFSDLPQELGSRIFSVIKTGSPVSPFKHQLPSSPNAFFQVWISPFKTQNSTSPNAALLLIEDITQFERSQRLEIEASNLRLVKSMAEHLAHEIGNSLVPISTHHQLLPTSFNDPEFRASLNRALGEGVKRISRLASQMMFLARDRTDFRDTIEMSELIREAFRDANRFHAGDAPDLDLKLAPCSIKLAGDRKALHHALFEILLNAIQANPGKPGVAVSMKQDDDAKGNPCLNLEVRDSGSGFSEQTANQAVTPFFSTRSVGLGLGLTVTRKIIEDHKGKIEILPSRDREPGVVRISLPTHN